MTGCFRLIVPLILALGLAASPRCGEGLVAWGIRSQGSVDLLPGNDLFFGPSLYYSNFYFFRHELQISATYLTNRPEAAWRQGVPVQDWYLLTPIWHWNRNGFFDFTLQTDLGMTWFDDEGLGLDNVSALIAPALGLNLNLGQGRYGIQATLGYQVLTSALVHPGMASVGIWAML